MSIYLELYNGGPIHRIELTRARVRRSRIKLLAKSLAMREAALAADLGIRPGKSKFLPLAPSERVIGLMSLVGSVEKMVARSGASDFDSAKWLGAWLSTPLSALGGVRPGSYLDTIMGQDLLGRLIGMAEASVYA